jgi:Rrf2 family protein
VISKSGIHAIRAITVLAGLVDGEYRGAAAIARATGSPANYLSKLLHQMSRAGIILSQKGQGGGFRLPRPPEEMTVFEVVEAIDDMRAWTRCIFGNPECSDTLPCGMHERWQPVRDAFLTMLKTTTIADVVAGSNPAVNSWITPRAAAPRRTP